MSEFTKSAARLDQLAEDYKTAALSCKLANSEAVETMVAISTRLQEEQKRTDERIGELEATINNVANRSATVRKMATLELERQKAYKPTITAEERKAFEEKAAEFEQALSDMRKIKVQLQETRASVKRQIEEEFKISVIYPTDTESLSNTLASLQDEFVRRFGEETV